MVKNHFDALAARSTVYLYRFRYSKKLLFLMLRSGTGMGGFVLSFIDKKTGEISHKKLNRRNDGNLSCIDTKGTTYSSFKALHKVWNKRSYLTPRPWQNCTISKNQCPTVLFLYSFRAYKGSYVSIVVYWNRTYLPLVDLLHCFMIISTVD